MQTFNNDRLRSARLLAGLSLRQLEEKLSSRVTYNSISKYEKGQMQPDNGTIVKLAEALRVTPGYFFEKNTIELGAIEFRKKSSLNETEIEIVKEKTKDKLERYIQAESLLNISSKFKNPISHYSVATAAKAEQMAEIIRNEWSLGSNPIPNVIEMLEENEVKVIEVEASDKFDGLSTMVNKSIPVTVINDSFTIERKRFTALHELGHVTMSLTNMPLKEKEDCCHRFAAAFLFPKDEVFKTLGEKRSNIAMGELVALKEEYGISVQAIMKRAFDLEIITMPTYKKFCIGIARNKKEEGLGAYKGEEKSGRLLQLVLRLASENIVTVDKAASLAGLFVNEFYSILNSTDYEDSYELYSSVGTSFNMAWENNEPEYTLDDLKTINPSYETR
ncbi:MAG TPA: XRE family transcriptional regulator [Chitinophagaceae bacterium]|nr:XRE family transcriptional regulator [Chitinophagaceae bacterium]